MSKFNKRDVTAAPGENVITTDTQPSGWTHEGRPGYARDAKSELFLLAVSNLVGQDTFYERAQARDDRFSALVRQVAVEDVEWFTMFLGWLRQSANMRSASIVAAIEAARALNDAKIPGGRRLVEASMARADEPGEALAYHIAKYGRKLPKPIKRGVADAAINLYTEYALLKYDTGSHAYRFGDVIELTHPGDDKGSAQHLRGQWQKDLFKLALERRHNRGNAIPETLPMIVNNLALANASTEALLDSEKLRAAGLTWEDVLSRAGSNVDKSLLWSALIPTMGYMALLRNLRNFDEAGVSDEVADLVVARLTNPELVARSRQFPFRFHTAYKFADGSLRWGRALERALQMSLVNVPALTGRTLVLVDMSPSMFPAWYTRQKHESKVERWEQAALFGSALALRAASADLVGFGHGNYRVPFAKHDAVLRVMSRFRQDSGTDSYMAAHDHFQKHDRIVVVTDGENNGYVYRSYREAGIPDDVPIYTWNIGGYKFAGDPGNRNRPTFAGLTDQAWQMIPLLEAGRDGRWPWEATS